MLHVIVIRRIGDHGVQAGVGHEEPFATALDNVGVASGRHRAPPSRGPIGPGNEPVQADLLFDPD